MGTRYLLRVNQVLWQGVNPCLPHVWDLACGRRVLLLTCWKGFGLSEMWLLPDVLLLAARGEMELCSLVSVDWLWLSIKPQLGWVEGREQLLQPVSQQSRAEGWRLAHSPLHWGTEAQGHRAMQRALWWWLGCTKKWLLEILGWEVWDVGVSEAK